MNFRHLRMLIHIKRFTSAGLLLGFIVFLSNFLASDLTQEYFLFIGLSIMVSSMLIFGFGMFIALIGEADHASKKVKEHHPVQRRLYLVKK